MTAARRCAASAGAMPRIAPIRAVEIASSALHCSYFDDQHTLPERCFTQIFQALPLLDCS
jgi:hypothetical protein